METYPAELSLTLSFQSLRSTRFVGAIIVFSVIHIGIFYYLMSKFPHRFAKQRQHAWINTLFASVVMTGASIPFVFSWFSTGQDLRQFNRLDSEFGNMSIAFFMSYLLVDLLFGWMHYPSQMNIVTGWIHHSLYLILLPILVSCKVGGGFMICSFLEFPTIILALGYLNDAWRSEYLFGVTFFLTRIVFHIYFSYRILITTPNLLPPMALTLPIHLHWFKRWIERQLKLRRQGPIEEVVDIPKLEKDR